MSETCLHTFAAMGTVVSLTVNGWGAGADQLQEREARVRAAISWFRAVENVCSRFDPASELSRLSDRVSVPVPVSSMLFQLVEFALALARGTDGAFDPTIGKRMEARGFNRSHRTGETVITEVPVDESVSFRDVYLDPREQTITLSRPLLLDLGAVAKGLAVDLAARELSPLENYAVDAGGDLYLGGSNATGEPWLVGIRDPREPDGLVECLRLSNAAICTSGDYERSAGPGRHHVIDPRSGLSASLIASASVIAESALVADGLATAAMVLGPDGGLELLRRENADGLLITTDLQRYASPGMVRHLAIGGVPVTTPPDFSLA